MSDFEFPKRGIVFWPVGVGDSTTVIVDEEAVLQIDLHHLKTAEEDDDPRVPIVDRLVELLPTRDGKPYLAAFAATHLDEDHILGFAELLDRVRVGDLWFTPRIFRDVEEGSLCEDGKVFAQEAERRIEEVRVSGEVGSGDRIRIIGHDELLSEPPYSDLPAGSFVKPGELLTALDGEDHKDVFRAFVHAPFKNDGSKERNDTSLALQVTLRDGEQTLNALTFGDLCYPDLKNIFARSEADDLLWNALLAPHHCSKGAMYWAEEDGEEPKLCQDILDAMKEVADSPGIVVVSADKIPGRSQAGDNPPHAKAANRYREIAPDGVICTGQHPNAEAPEPLVFEVSGDGAGLRDAHLVEASASALAKQISEARGEEQVPAERVGFGRR